MPVFGVDPELIREGSTIPIAQDFQEVTAKSVMMLPIGAHDDGEHSQNEKMSRWESHDDVQDTFVSQVNSNRLYIQ